MKPLFTLTIALLCACAACAQTQPQKQLPDTIRFKLTKAQYIDMMAHIDSATQLLSNTSSQPSNAISAFNARVLKALQPIGFAAFQQLVDIKADTVKKPKKSN